MSDFDIKAQGWDKPDRVKMAEEIASCMLSELNPSPDMIAADFGAGTGLTTLEIAKKVKHIIAIDSSEGMLEVLKKKITAGRINNIELKIQKIEDSDSGIKGLDIIVSSMTMHHVKNTGALAANLYSMLKSGGRAAIADLEKEDGSFHADPGEGVKHHGFDSLELSEIFRKNGFKNISFVPVYIIARNNREYPVFLMLAEK